MLDYVALGILIFAFITVFYGIIVVHDIPYEIAMHRNHPHQDAIHVAGWISLLFMGAIWPFLWIWATLYREDRGWGFKTGSNESDQKDSLMAQLAALEARLDQLEQSGSSEAAEDNGDIEQTDQEQAENIDTGADDTGETR